MSELMYLLSQEDNEMPTNKEQVVLPFLEWLQSLEANNPGAGVAAVITPDGKGSLLVNNIPVLSFTVTLDKG
jgi:uncharacterized protein (DUF934 family)